MSKPPYSLKEIANWADENSKIKLPNVQRDFVWKPSQIEDLWDSILRGYPIGSFVLSKSEKSNKLELLDGQQRATTIALGFAAKTFRESERYIRLFIDLAWEPPQEDNRKFLFRVITASHPWGYKISDNTKTLDSTCKENALLLFGVEDFLDVPLAKFFPYEAQLPIPFSILMNSSSISEVIDELNNWDSFQKIKSNFIKSEENNIRAEDGFNIFINEKIASFLKIIEGMKILNPCIPALFLDIHKFNSNLNLNDFDINDKSSDEIENLFIRLNSKGTPIKGEDLNYSILKVHLNSDLLKKVEGICKNRFKPPRLISILFRLYTNRDNLNPTNVISLKIKTKIFQQLILKEKEDFENFIEEILDNTTYNINNKKLNLIEYALEILAYKKDFNTYGLPYIVYSRLSKSSPEIMLILLYRLKMKNDKIELNSGLHRKMLGVITLMYWLGRGARGRDYTNLLRNVWPAVTKINRSEEFWSSALINRAQIDEVMSYFPKFFGAKGIESFLKGKISKIKSRDPLELGKPEELLAPFLYATLFNNDLVAYAQREFLDNQFKPKHFGLEDTDIPFDWDHISPQKSLPKNAAKPIRGVYHTIGNHRAWPFSLNRKDQANSPYAKFNRNFEDDASKYWTKQLKTNINSALKLKETLLQLSFCEADWLEHKKEKLKEYKDWKPVYESIMKRNIELYREWYSNLKIDELFPLKRNDELELSHLFYSHKWVRKSKEFKKYFSENDLFYTMNYTLFGNKIHFYFYYPIDSELKQNNFYFGLMETKGNNILSKIKWPDKFNIFDDEDDYFYIQGEFTLVAKDECSYKMLLDEIKAWLKLIPDKSFQQKTIGFLNKTIMKKFNTQEINK